MMFYRRSLEKASATRVSTCLIRSPVPALFLWQLLQSGLIHPDDLERKYRKELHANEILLLAYYIASVNIEEAFRGQRGGDSDYKPFEGIILTDTFNLNKSERPTLFPKDRMAENNERAEHQQKLQIEVIIGNPPWSAGTEEINRRQSERGIS